MKKLYLLVLCVLSAMLVNAQRPMWNVKLGLGASSWMGDGFGSSKSLFNQRIGVGVDIPLTGWVSFQTGLNWTSKGAKYSLVGDTKQTVNQNYFEMPILAAFHIGTPKNFDVVIAGGGYIGYGIVGKTEQKADDVTSSWATFNDACVSHVKIWDGLRRFDAGIQAGINLDFRHYLVGVEGEFGLARMWKDGPRNLAIFATVGYKF